MLTCSHVLANTIGPVDFLKHMLVISSNGSNYR